MKCSMIKFALAATVAIGASALMAQEMGAAAEQPQTVTEQIDPDKGPQIVQEAEAKQPEVKATEEAQAESEKFVPAGEAVRTMLKKQLKLKEGYDRKKKAIIVIGEAAKKISDPAAEKAFMNIRATKALEAYVGAKAEIIRSINNDVKGIDRIACQYAAGEDDVMKVYAEKKAAFEAKKEQLAKALAVLDEKEADALAGVTLSDRFGAILDGIAKKLDSAYSKEQIEADKKAAYEEVKGQVAALQEEYKALEKDADSVPKYPSNEIKNDVVMTAKQPLLGAYVLLQAESWDKNEGVYEVAVAVVWSPKLEANALKLIQGDLTPSANKGQFSVDDWVEQQYLPCMIGSRRITDNEGHAIYIGIGAEDISGSVMNRKAKKALADTDAIQAVARALFSDVDTYREASRNLKEYTDDLATSKERLTEVTTSKHDVNLKGCSRLTSVECEHPITGRKTYISVYYIDPALNKEAIELMKKAYANAGLAVKATQYARGLHAGQQAALEGIRQSKAEFNRGMRDGKKGVEKEIEKAEAARRNIKKPVSVGGAGSKRQNNAGQSNGGTFSGDSNVDTDF